jgi:hypothetical protein
MNEAKERRYLIHHAESDCLFETRDGALVAKACSEDGCDDVTDIPEFENRFKEQKENEANNSRK